MSIRSTRKIKKALRKKGFVEVEGGKHIRFLLKLDGLLQPVATIISRGSSYKEYGGRLFNDMAKQLHLSNQELEQFVDCPLTMEQYLALLRERGHIQ